MIRITHGGKHQEIERPKATRRLRPFGMPQTPFDPASGKYLPLGLTAAEEGAVAVMTVQSEADDYLVCYDSQYQEVYVAKPYLLRRTPFDGLEVNSITYTYSASNTRSATDGTDTETQVITPSYYDGEEILAVAHETGITTTAAGEIVWEDVNTAGRAWAVEE